MGSGDDPMNTVEATPTRTTKPESIMNTVAIDILTECAQAGQSPAYVATDDQADLVHEANERFVELASPAFRSAAERVGVELVITSDAAEIDRINRSWGDDAKRNEAWQAVHDAVDVDLAGLARTALAEAAT